MEIEKDEREKQLKIISFKIPLNIVPEAKMEIKLERMIEFLRIQYRH